METPLWQRPKRGFPISKSAERMALKSVVIVPEVKSLARQRTSNCAKCGALKVILRNQASRCMPCSNRRARKYYHNSEARRLQLRRQHVKRRYGVSIETLELMLKDQRGCCAICRRPWQECPSAKRVRYETSFLHHVCVDHDHALGRVRGLLCNACNTAIGLFEEKPERFSSAMDYLRHHARRT
jgi:hypothetical protein